MSMQMAKRVSLTRPWGLNKSPHEIEPLYPFTGYSALGPDAPIHLTRPWTQRPVHRWTPHVIGFKRCSSDSNGYDADRTLRLKLTGRWNISVRSSTVRVKT